MVVVASLPAGCLCTGMAEPMFGSSAVRYVHVPATGIMVLGWYKILVQLLVMWFTGAVTGADNGVRLGMFFVPVCTLVRVTPLNLPE